MTNNENLSVGNAKHIAINEEKFKKASKKLLTNLESYQKPLKLNQAQEILAKSLGFRNLYDLQTFFTNPVAKDSQNFLFDNEYSNQINVSSFFQKLEKDQAIQIVSNLMLPGAAMWKTSALSLISIIISALIHLRDKEEILLNVDVICEYLILDNLIKLYRIKGLPLNIKNELNQYLVSLPSFNEYLEKQSSVTQEQHGYIKIQFHLVFENLRKIEKNDFFIADSKWFDLKTINKSEKNAQTLVVIEKLRNLDFLKDSWLKNSAITQWVKFLVSKNSLFSVTVSDLLIYIPTITSSDYRHKMNLILNNLLENYSMASLVSKKINNEI